MEGLDQAFKVWLLPGQSLSILKDQTQRCSLWNGSESANEVIGKDGRETRSASQHLEEKAQFAR
jgi:hypothetical protein